MGGARAGLSALRIYNHTGFFVVCRLSDPAQGERKAGKSGGEGKIVRNGLPFPLLRRHAGNKLTRITVARIAAEYDF